MAQRTKEDGTKYFKIGDETYVAGPSDLLGKGTYGIVYKVHNEKDASIKKAIKTFSQDSMDENDGIPSTTLREINAMMTLDHPNVMKAQDVVFPKGGTMMDMFVVMELCKGTLKDKLVGLIQEHLKSDCRWTRPTPHMTLPPSYVREVKIIAFQLLNALAVLHSRGIMHRDLKPVNIMWGFDDLLKLGDFGLARFVRGNQNSTDNVMPQTGEVQTMWYRAPEVLLGDERYGLKVDDWSIGCILAEMFRFYRSSSGKIMPSPLFAGKSDVETLLMIFDALGTPKPHDNSGEKYLENLPNWSSEYPQWSPTLRSRVCLIDDCGFDLLSRLLRTSPFDRQAAKFLLQHEWFNSVRSECAQFVPWYRGLEEGYLRMVAVDRLPPAQPLAAVDKSKNINATSQGMQSNTTHKLQTEKSRIPGAKLGPPQSFGEDKENIRRVNNGGLLATDSSSQVSSTSTIASVRDVRPPESGGSLLAQQHKPNSSKATADSTSSSAVSNHLPNGKSETLSVQGEHRSSSYSLRDRKQPDTRHDVGGSKRLNPPHPAYFSNKSDLVTRHQMDESRALLRVASNAALEKGNIGTEVKKSSTGAVKGIAGSDRVGPLRKYETNYCDVAARHENSEAVSHGAEAQTDTSKNSVNLRGLGTTEELRRLYSNESNSTSSSVAEQYSSRTTTKLGATKSNSQLLNAEPSWKDGGLRKRTLTQVERHNDCNSAIRLQPPAKVGRRFLGNSQPVGAYDAEKVVQSIAEEVLPKRGVAPIKATRKKVSGIAPETGPSVSQKETLERGTAKSKPNHRFGAQQRPVNTFGSLSEKSPAHTRSRSPDRTAVAGNAKRPRKQRGQPEQEQQKQLDVTIRNFVAQPHRGARGIVANEEGSSDVPMASEKDIGTADDVDMIEGIVVTSRNAGKSLRAPRRVFRTVAVAR